MVRVCMAEGMCGGEACVAGVCDRGHVWGHAW